MIRCEDCGKGVVEVLKFANWYRLVFFIECLHSEGIIEDATRDSMTDALMSFKAFAMEDAG